MRPLFCLFCLASLIVLEGTQASFAEKSRSELMSERMARCDANLLACDNDCLKIIDIDNAIRDCKNRCEVRHARCQKRAGARLIPDEGTVPT
jgi:hypothetical protein